MSLRKIDDNYYDKDTKTCLDPAHNPPMHIVLEPGTYEHTCPNCGYKIIFTVPRVTC